MRILVNFIAFQLGWFACVLGAAWDRPWAGTGIALAIVAWHLARAPQPGREATLVLTAAVLGAAWDSLLAGLGWIRYPSGVLLAGTAPHWIVALWMLFATTLNLSLAWLKPRMALALAFGAIGGPLAYLAGARLGALVIASPGAALTALAAGWALATPLLLALARRYDGFPSAQHDGLHAEVSHG